MQRFDIIIPSAKRDVSFVPRVIKYIRLCLAEVDNIYVLTAHGNIKYLEKKIRFEDRCFILDENLIIPHFSIEDLKKFFITKKLDLRAGWYFQQFLKIGFSLSDYCKDYYMSWDSDTLPLSKISFFDEEDHPLFTEKVEYNENYFKTIKNLLGLEKSVSYSFIAEHMLFKKDIVIKLIDDIGKSSIDGNSWWEKVLNACDYHDPLPPFSEFETYGTYCINNYPELYKSRKLNTFRCAGFINGRNISDEKLSIISIDIDIASFEMKHEPLFPYNIPHIISKWQSRFDRLRGISIIKIPRKMYYMLKNRKENVKKRNMAKNVLSRIPQNDVSSY